MPWFSDRAGPASSSRERHQRCCLPLFWQRRHPGPL